MVMSFKAFNMIGEIGNCKASSAGVRNAEPRYVN